MPPSLSAASLIALYHLCAMHLTDPVAPIPHRQSRSLQAPSTLGSPRRASSVRRGFAHCCFIDLPGQPLWQIRFFLLPEPKHYLHLPTINAAATRNSRSMRIGIIASLLSPDEHRTGT